MEVLPSAPRDIARLRPRRLSSPPATLTFATLNGCVSPSKGAEVMASALRALRQRGLAGRFRLLVVGHVHPSVREEVAEFPGVELIPGYDRRDLDRLLERVDVGIVPSAWEEVLGYTGIEMLAKGIPLVANPLGGIVEYAREGETAWLNHSCTGEGIAEIVATLVAEPGGVVAMHKRVVAARDSVVLPMTRQAPAVEALYRELVQSSSVR
jgi:glycosyltransferase involved in cell wall biosynthesis